MGQSKETTGMRYCMDMGLRESYVEANLKLRLHIAVY